MDIIRRFDMGEIESRLIDVFKKAAWEIGQIETGALSLATRVSDLDIDSIMLLEIIGHVETAFNVDISEEQLLKAKTLRDISLAIRIKMQEAY
jgi:acyl carrier protein